jgi:hypothetical protein
MKNLPDGIKISELKSGGWIDCTKLQQLNTQLQKLREKLENLVVILEEPVYNDLKVGELKIV